MRNSASDKHKNINGKEYSYNLSELIQLSNGNNDFLANMVGIFIRSSSEIMSKMKNAMVNNDWKNVSELAHKAGPSFHFMGLNNFSEKLKFIENNSANEREHKIINEMIGFIDRNLTVILEDLEKEVVKFKK